MNDNARSAPWYAPWRSVERAPAADDPADLGTAFGLDLSMAPAEEPPPAAPKRRDTSPGRWLDRLPLRRRRLSV